MSKIELGVKRRCLTCAKPFFDLNRTPIVCPCCKSVFQVVELARSAPRQTQFGYASFKNRGGAAPILAELPLPPAEAADETVDAAADEDSAILPIEDEEEVQIEAVI